MKTFFDRNDERKVIDEAIMQINQNCSTIIWLEGESGVGKTHLLKHSLKNATCSIFKYYGYKYLYKCDQQDLNQEFSFVSAILSTLQNMNPKVFQEKLYNYFSNNNYIHILDAFETILPSIPGFNWSKDLFNKFNSQTETARKYIIDKTLKSTMILCFSEIILDLLEYYFCESNILFCIDDMVWMDFTSLETLETIISKSKMTNKYNVKISLFITTRSRKELETRDFQNYDKIESDFFDELFDLKYCIMLSNFKKTILKEIIYSEKRYNLHNYTEALYRVTAGNPQEISQTLKFKDEDIIRRIEENSSTDTLYTRNDKFFSNELIESVCEKNKYALLILGIVSMTEKYLKPQLLLAICSSYNTQLLDCSLDYGEYELAVNLLKNNDLIDIDEFVCIKHDSVKALINEYISETGDFYIIGKIVSSLFINDSLSKDENYIFRVKIALDILKTIDPYLCFKIFADLLKKDKRHFSYDNVDIIALCINRSFNNISVEEINEIVIPEILQTLVSTGKHTTAKRMCELLMHNFDLISHNNKKIYLTCYAKVLIDIGNIKESHTGESYALQILDKLISCSDNDNELLLTYLLKMSAHEHVLEFQEIKELYKKSNKIIENNPHLDHISLSKFYRNKGLVAFHTELENDYLKAYEYAQKIKDYSMRNIMEGTCHNNIGLMYFYKGDLTQALNHFNSAYNSLNCVGYDMLRVVNNIATCYFMLGDFENSYKYIAIAKSHPLKGIFEELCIDVNLALNLYKCGQKTEAKRRLDCIINEYNSQNTRTDTAVYSAAMVNRGYIYLVEEDYINAYKMFKSSTCHTYKNKNDIEQRKREELCMICLHKEGILTDAIKNHIDLNEQTNIIFERPYSLMLLAFYII